MTGHLSLFLTSLHTNLLGLRPSQDGPQIYSVWLVLIPLPSSLMQPGLQPHFFTANLSVLCKSASWQIGPPPVEFMKNFIRNIYEDDMILCMFAV